MKMLVNFWKGVFVDVEEEFWKDFVSWCKVLYKRILGFCFEVYVLLAYFK